MLIPSRIKSYLTTWFDFPTSPTNCQVATLIGHFPHIRTMMLYDVTNQGHLIVITSTDTRKWTDLQQTPQVAVCLYHPSHGQITMEGTAKLMTSQDFTQEVAIFWEKLSPYWQNFYYSKSPSLDPSSSKIPPSFGVIVIIPNMWEILEICEKDYLKSIRKQYILKEGTWSERDLLPV